MRMNKIKLNVIGDPIEHSKSPVVHGMVLNALDVPYEYEKVHVKKGGLKEYVERAIDSGVTGFNLTMPHKVDIIPYLEEIDEDARLFGAVNTVKIREGKLYGYNTDARGFILSLNSCGADVKGKNIVILGAGGVVSTLALKFAVSGANGIVILNRTPKKAADICTRIEKLKEEGVIDTEAELLWNNSETSTINKYIGYCHILINATPLGMSGVEGDYTDLSFIDGLPKQALAADLIYNPSKTRFLAYAEKKGNKIMNGLGMLIGQAILADEIYLERELDVSELFTNLLENYCEN